MFRIVLVTTLLVAGLASIPAIAAEDHVAVSADQLKWGPAPPAVPKGAQIAILAGDPSKDGLYVYRVKVPAGYKVPPHIHPNDENVTVISGTLNIGMGGAFDEKKWASTEGRRVFYICPRACSTLPGLRRYDYSGARMGPQAITYVNPADDPRKSN